MYLIINYKNKKSEYLPDMRMIIHPEKLTVGPSDYIFKSTITAIISDNSDVITAIAFNWKVKPENVSPSCVSKEGIISYIMVIPHDNPTAQNQEEIQTQED